MSEHDTSFSGYSYEDSDLNHSHGFLLPTILDLLANLEPSLEKKLIFNVRLDLNRVDM